MFLLGWEIWAAATASSTTVRDVFISAVLKYAGSGFRAQPFGDWYDTTNGTADIFTARPVIGSHFAFVSIFVLFGRGTP